jgi:hypothetical protein
MAASQPKREDYEYERNGKCAFFLAVEPLAGFRQVWVRSHRTKLDFATVLKELVDDIYPNADKVVLVVNNLNIHHPACFTNVSHRPKPGASPKRSSGITHRFLPAG